MLLCKPQSYTRGGQKLQKKLGFACDDGRISDEALERFSKFYHDLPNRDHVEALAALFGWAVPSDVLADGS